MDAEERPDSSMKQTPDDDPSEKSVVCAAVQAIRRGEGEEFRHLVNLYQKRLFALALMTVRDPSGAEDVTQDAFVSAYTHLNQYDECRPFYPWLATIAIRHALTWIRRRTRLSSREAIDLSVIADKQASGGDMLDSIIFGERDQRLWQLVAALPKAQRIVVFLYYRQELKIDQIAHALGITSGTVKTLMFRARRTLRQALRESNYGSLEAERRTQQ
jgi:RNA polymerase sigma-70 factor (ECF subfamily)